MNIKKIGIQLVGNALLAGVAWDWLGLKVATPLQVALNVGIAVALLLAWAVLDAYGLGNWRNWPWAIPAVAITPLIGMNFGMMVLIPLLWIMVLLPSAAAGRFKLLAGPRYLLMAIGLLIVMGIVPMALLGWIPKLEGFNAQAVSFGGRAALAFVIAIGAWASLLEFIGREARAPEIQDLGTTKAGDEPVSA